ncbi:MAG: hypothetical protein NZT92_05410 [Abditibacteriales bacterium]|nr:hypothetical protein [Abditibacteriales bacterium]MDW8368221.1 hypothetical protein [Abditibacteriales bacterium]
MFYSTVEEQWRECLGELWGVADERALPTAQRQLLERIREETFALLAERGTPMTAAEILESLPTASEALVAACATSRFDAAKDILARLLRADRRFRRYDAETFGLAVWDDEKHFLYYWSAIERAWHVGDASEFERLAAAVERLQLPAERKRRVRAVMRTYWNQLLQSPSARARAAGGAAADKSEWTTGR